MNLIPNPVNGMSMRLSRAFTLVELLVVIAIILILIAIGLPNFMTALTRSRVSSAYSEMRSMGTALEVYFVDYGEYPQAALTSSRWRPRGLVEPVPYMEELPTDLFASAERSRGYGYGAMDLRRASRWLLVSQGPDRGSNTDPVDFYPGYDPLLFIGQYFEETAEGDGHYNYLCYSPTNGVVSVGDLYVTSDAGVIH